MRSCRPGLRVEPWREAIYRWLMGYLAVRRCELLRVFIASRCRRAYGAVRWVSSLATTSFPGFVGIDAIDDGHVAPARCDKDWSDAVMRAAVPESRVIVCPGAAWTSQTCTS